MSDREHQKRKERKLAARVTAAFLDQSRPRLHAAKRAYLNSFAARYTAAAEVLEKAYTHDSAMRLAGRIDLWQPCGEVARVLPVAKKNRPMHDPSYRFIFSFGRENRTRQVLIRNLLEARWATAPGQTMFGGGRAAAVRQTQQHFAEGFTHVVEADIRKCFNSFGMAGTASFLSLPEAVVNLSLSGRSLNVAPHITWLKDHHMNELYGLFDLPQTHPRVPPRPMDVLAELYGEDWVRAQQGLIEGALCSSRVAELLLADICQVLGVPDYGRLVNYADNFLLMARSQSDAAQLLAVLQDALLVHPAGPLTVKEDLNLVPHGHAFEFLGYRFTPSQAELAVTWSSGNEAKARTLRRDCYRILGSSRMPFARKASVLAETEGKHRNFVYSFASWPGARALHEEKMGPLRRMLESARPNIPLETAKDVPL